MKCYKISLKSTSAITQLPDSQKVFGALITMVAKTQGNEKATAMVKAVYNKDIHLALSNVLPLDYFPMPQDYVVDKLAELVEEGKNKEAGTSLKELRARVKERTYVKEEGLNSALHRPKLCNLIYPYIKQSDEQQLRASIDSVMYGIEGMESKLYTVPTLKLIEMKGDHIGDPISSFCFYLQGEESESLTSLLGIIDNLLQNEISLVLGKRASQGLNRYQVTAIEEISIPKANCYLNLGMLLPNDIDYESSTLKLFTSERRPFAMQGGWNQNCEKYFISFINSGSVIALQNGIENAGKCVPSPFHKDRDIVFGNAFLYPIDCEGKS